MFFILASTGLTHWQASKGEPPSPVASSKEDDEKGAAGDIRYLLVRRAGRPERNYYELTRTARFLEPQLYKDGDINRFKPSPRNFGFDIETELTVRYGVYQAWKVRVVGSSDSPRAPTSTKVSAYVLIYPRNPDWRFCARKYRFEALDNGARKITYTDFQDGREYTFRFGPEWPRPWQIYEVKILNSNAFLEIWRASKQPNADVH
jgi:hypothetical protein